jgi:AcrR family transcriptional regulator
VPGDQHVVKNDRSFYIERMPRVSAAHLEARRRQILDAATTCFTRNGFHGTSMQDVIAEAGLSVGAVYRYFASKHELIRAIAEENLAQVIGVLDELIALDPPPPLFELIEKIMIQLDPDTGPKNGFIRMAVQVWGESLRDPDLAAMIDHIYWTVRHRWTVVVEHAVAAGQLSPETDPAGAGSAIFGLIIGHTVQRLLLGDPDRETYLAGLRSLVVSRGEQGEGNLRHLSA